MNQTRERKTIDGAALSDTFNFFVGGTMFKRELKLISLGISNEDDNSVIYDLSSSFHFFSHLFHTHIFQFNGSFSNTSVDFCFLVLFVYLTRN